MTAKNFREIVIEFERVQLTRKRARTEVVPCHQCEEAVDFVGVVDAAELFELDADEILEFAVSQGCHFRTSADGEIALCVRSMFNAMDKKYNGSIRLIGPKFRDNNFLETGEKNAKI